MNQFAAVLLAVVAVATVDAKTPDADPARLDFKKLARELPFLALDSVLYDREDLRFDLENPKEEDEHIRIIAKVTDKRYSKEVLIRLLGDGDAKVRTLAAVALFDRDDASVLPELAALCSDEAPTFDGHGKLSASWLAITGIGPPRRNQTVGYVVRGMLEIYVNRVGIYSWGSGKKPEAVFAEYWEDRSDRAHCASWFSVYLHRAHNDRNPDGTPSLSRIRALRRQIDAIGPDEAAWVLLSLHGRPGSEILVPEEELVEIIKNLGPDKLLQFLGGKMPSDDPDLQPRKDNNELYQSMAIFVLRHAEKLFRSNDSFWLRDLEQDYRNNGRIGVSRPTPWWAVGAAQLNRNRASEILRDALKRFEGKYDSENRAVLCGAMWRMGGEGEAIFLRDWFYNERPVENSYPIGPGIFIRDIAGEPNGREMIVHLIKDVRLEALDFESLKSLIHVVNRWTETPVVTGRELQSGWHPFPDFHRSQARGEAEYPKETAALRAHLSEWRKRLRASVSSLLPAKTDKTVDGNGK
jgi:hypothetical protein